MNAEKETSPKKSDQKKKQKETVPLALHEERNIYDIRQDQIGTKKESLGENKTDFGNTAIPAVHGADPAYADGSESMYQKLQNNLDKTGDLSHPETQQKEKDYKQTLSISELRNYNDVKTENPVDVTPAKPAIADMPAKTEDKAPDENKVAETNSKAGQEVIAITIENNGSVSEVSSGIEAITPVVAAENNFSVSEGPKNTAEEAKPQPDNAAAEKPKAPAVAAKKRGKEVVVPLSTVSKDDKKRTSVTQPIISQGKAKKASSAPAPAPKTAKNIDAGKVNGLDVSRSFMNNNPVIEQAASNGSIQNFKPQQAPKADNLKNSSKGIMDQAAETNAATVTNENKQMEGAIQQNKAVNAVNPTIKATPVKTAGIYNSKDFSPITPQLEALPGYKESINETNSVYVDDKINPKLDEQKIAQEDFAKQQADAKVNNDKQINDETIAVRAEQVKQQAEVKSDVARHKKDWKKESDEVKTNYDREAKGKKQTMSTDVDNEVNTANTQINDSYNEANRTAAEETAKAKKQEADQRAEADRKSKDKSLWDKAVDFVSDIFDALKKALNKLFDGLKALVKRAIDAAKKFVNNLIDKLKEKVKALIRDFGEALKAIVNVVLAKFPKLRDKFNKLIDDAVNKALKAVDVLAEGLKKTINALLDVLGNILIAILDAAQAYYNAILDVCKFLVVGLIRIAEFIVNLHIAAYQSGGEFFGALAEESLGGNPAQPLQDVEVPFGQEAQWASAMAIEPGKTQQPVQRAAEETGDLLTKSKLDDNDVTTDPYPAIEADRTFLDSIPPLKEGEQFDIGGAGSKSVTTAQLQQSVYGNSDVNEQETEGVQETVAAPADKDAPDWRNMSDEAKLNHYNTQMLESSKDAGSQQPTPGQTGSQPDMDNSPEALVTKTGRLNPGRRLAFMGEQMMIGIQALWNQYKGWIIAGLIVALVAIAAILFFSGGTALGLVVQAIGEALILIFGAVAVYRAMGSIWDYVKKAWAGDTKGAAKALATAFAIIVVEFLLDKILAGMGKVFKRILKSFKASKAGRFIRNTVAVVRKGQRTTRNLVRSGMVAIRNSKFVIFLEKIVAKGARKFDDLRNKILTKFGFKRIWFERHGKHMQLWGEFNSKVLLMEEDAEGNKTYRVEDDKTRKVGKVGSKQNNGIVLDETGNKFSENVSAIQDQQVLGDIYNRLDNLSEADRLKKIQTGNPHASSRADWDAHETAVNDNLAITHPGQRSAQQVTLDLYDQNGDFLTTIRADNAVVDEFGTVTLIDAKHQANAEVARGIKKPMKVVTDNQAIGYPAIKNGNVGKVVPRGEGADILNIKGREITINPTIEIHTNDINGNIVRMDLDGNIIP